MYLHFFQKRKVWECIQIGVLHSGHGRSHRGGGIGDRSPQGSLFSYINILVIHILSTIFGNPYPNGLSHVTIFFISLRIEKS